MSKRDDLEAAEIRWNGRKKRYEAKLKNYPAITAFGATLVEAKKNLRLAIQEHLGSKL